MSYLPPGHPPLKFHPLANLFPMLTDADLDDLGEDIRINGQVETVKLHRGMVLDGRNRYTACGRKALGVRSEIFTGSDREALNWVISKNLKRRHLTESQRAMVAARLGALKLGDNQHTRQPAPIGAPALPLGGGTEVAAPPEPALSQSERADMLSVSRRQVQRADEVLAKAAPEVVTAIENGAVKVSAASEIANLPVDEQRKLVEQFDPKVVKEAAKKNRAQKAVAGRDRRLANMAKGDATPLLDGGGKVGVFYVDIPREFVKWSEETGADKSPENHYRVENFQFLADMRDRILARAQPNAIIFMWAWANSLPDQLDLLAEWGFAGARRRDEAGRLLRDTAGRILPAVGEGRYRSHQVWVKRAATGNLNRGTGFWFIDCHELLLVGARGDVPAPLMGTQAMSVIEAVVGAHSAKPNEVFRDQIDHYFPGVRKLELFGRVDDLAAFKARWPDWEVIGNDVVPAQTDAEMSSPPDDEQSDADSDDAFRPTAEAAE